MAQRGLRMGGEAAKGEAHLRGPRPARACPRVWRSGHHAPAETTSPHLIICHNPAQQHLRAASGRDHPVRKESTTSRATIEYI